MADLHPLSCNQELMLAFGAEFGFGTSTWNEQIVVDVDDLDVDQVCAVLRHLSARHDILRTRIARRDGTHCQEVVVESDAPLRRVGSGDVERVVDQEMSAPFDLTRGPLWRCATVPRAGGGGTVVLTLNHLVSDTQSDRLLAAEFVRVYDALGRERASTAVDTASPARYGDFARWQREQVARFVRDPGAVPSWSAYERTVRSMRADRPRGAGVVDSNGESMFGECTITLDAADTGRVAALGRAHRVTVNTIMTAMLCTAVHRLPHLRAGLVLGERSVRYPYRFAETLGPFPDPWPVSDGGRDATSFTAAVATVRDITVQAIEASLPFHLLLTRVPWLAREFRDSDDRIMIFYQYLADSSVTVDPGSRCTRVHFPDRFGEQSNGMGMHFLMGMRDGSLVGRVRYRSPRVSADDVARLVAEMQDGFRRECGHPVSIAVAGS